MSIDSLAIYNREIRSPSLPLLSREEEQDLAKEIQNGDKTARDKLITSNLRLVLTIANSYRNKLSLRREEHEDSISAGNAGLIRAVDKFDGEKGVKFNTYARCWIKLEIERGLNSAGVRRNFYTPEYLRTLRSQIPSFRESLETNLGRVATDGELIDFARAETGNKFSEETILLAMMSPTEICSLESPRGDGEFLKNYIRDKTSGLEAIAESNDIESYFSHLPSRTVDIMRLRYLPLNDELCKRYNISPERLIELEKNRKRIYNKSSGFSLNEVAGFLGVSKETIRKEEVSAFESFPELKQLLGYKPNKSYKEAKGSRHKLSLSYLGDSLETYLPNLSSNDQEIIRLVYNLGDEELRRKFNLGSKDDVTLKFLAPFYNQRHDQFCNYLKSIEERISYLHVGIPYGELNEMRRNALKKYSVFLEADSKLNEHDRSLINLKYLQNLPDLDVCKELRISLPQLKCRAIKAFRAWWGNAREKIIAVQNQ